MATRKRRAPGASPQVPQQPNLFPPDPDQFTTWNDGSLAPGDLGGPTYATDGMFDFSGSLGAPAGGTSAHNRIVSLDGLDGDAGTADDTSYSGQLVRRNPNQQLTARGRNAWDNFGNPNQGQWQQEGVEDDDEDLEQRALLARKDAQSKRKQIPPFVQKLSSFLDNNKNTNLIRWSDDGNSFIVLDEDEFARTLIPELFKHNNYASFVRQLNMYGFHKKVGLSDNSMKASEAKAKAPSEYYNKYFKRGRPELLWLIQKPKNPPGNIKRKRDDDGKQGDSDDDRKYVADTGGGLTGGGGSYVEENVALRGNTDMAVIPRAEYNSLRNEVQTLQQQQKVISSLLTRLRSQNDSLYQQALGFQTLHDRHENSINAILTFLATFYNRTLENNNGVSNLADLFGSAIPQQQPHGSVVDVGDYQDRSLTKSPQLPRQARRPLALLPAPAVKDTLGADRATTMSPSVRSAASPSKPPAKPAVFNRSPAPQRQSLQAESYISAPTPIKVDTASPPQVPTPLPENDEIMSAIQNANANAGQATSQGAQFDFPAALANYQAQGGNVPLTQQQRNEVLSIMANNASAASPNSSLAQNSNNAVATPQPPVMPDLSQFQATQNSLDLLQRMAEEQNNRVQNLHERLQPLSPSGNIPGLEDYFGNSTVGEPGQFDLDLDSFIPNEDYMTQNHPGDAVGGDMSLPDLNYDLSNHDLDLNGTGLTGDTSGEGLLGFDTGQDNRVESVSSSAASPAVTVEDMDEDRPKRSPKRRRK